MDESASTANERRLPDATVADGADTACAAVHADDRGTVLPALLVCLLGGSAAGGGGGRVRLVRQQVPPAGCHGGRGNELQAVGAVGKWGGQP